MKIDSHAHIFNANESYVLNARYIPNYTISIEQYKEVLNRNSFSKAVLIQPSFLGDNNELLIKNLNNDIKGVIVCKQDDIKKYIKNKNICGLRFNLINEDKKIDFSKEFLNIVKDNNLHIELHQNAKFLEQNINSLANADVKIVIDHLARASSISELEFLKKYKNCKIYFKISGFYRNGDLEFNKKLYMKLKEIFSINNFVFGSDYPHTNYENQCSFTKLYNEFLQIIDESEFVFYKNAKELFLF